MRRKLGFPLAAHHSCFPRHYGKLFIFFGFHSSLPVNFLFFGSVTSFPIK
jgi:hypothetical protein